MIHLQSPSERKFFQNSTHITFSTWRIVNRRQNRCLNIGPLNCAPRKINKINPSTALVEHIRCSPFNFGHTTIQMVIVHNGNIVIGQNPMILLSIVGCRRTGRTVVGRTAIYASSIGGIFATRYYHDELYVGVAGIAEPGLQLVQHVGLARNQLSCVKSQYHRNITHQT